MNQVRHQTLAALIAAGQTCSTGAGAHAATLNLTVGTKVLIDGDVNPVIAFRDSHEVAKAELTTRHATARARKDALYALIFGGRDLLKRTLGNQHSGAWDGTGFNTSLKIPQSAAKLQNTAGVLKAYLAANPAMEVPTVLTSDMLDLALDELMDAKDAGTLQKAVVGTQLSTRRQKEKALRLRLRWVVDELSRVLDPLDDRWTAFGFNKPGIKRKPTVPGKVTLSLLGDNALAVKWERSERAEYYRIWMKVDGQDDALVPVATSADLEFTRQDLPALKKIQVGITAVNNGGESAMTEIVEETTK